jgi:hypothetical protein
MSDALDELVRALAALERAEERMAQAAHGLAEAEGAAEDDPGAAAEVERRRKQYATAEAAAGFARARRRELEAQLEPAEVMRAHSLVGGDQ